MIEEKGLRVSTERTVAVEVDRLFQVIDDLGWRQRCGNDYFTLQADNGELVIGICSLIRVVKFYFIYLFK
jgi:hypothetical protein